MGWRTGRTRLFFQDPLWEGVPPLSVTDVQDKLHLATGLQTLTRLLLWRPDSAFACTWPWLSSAMSTVTSRLLPISDASSGTLAVRLFQHLGDAGAYISSAEAFVRPQCSRLYLR